MIGSVKRWLVVFRSHPSPPSDATVVDVRARTELAAIREARAEQPPQHPWAIATAIPWPRNCAGVDEAAARVSVGTR